MPTFIKICEIEIPFDAENFMTPDWKPVLDYHAQWVQLVDWRRLGMDPWPYQPFMLEYAKQLERLGERDLVRRRTADQWMTRCMEHYGLSFLSHYAQLKSHEAVR